MHPISALLTHLPTLLLFVGVCAGHLALLSVSLNVWYGHPFPKTFLSIQRKLHTLLVPVGLVALWALYGFNPAAAWNPPPTGWDVVPAIYVLCCIVMGLVVLPLATAARVLRRLPALLLSNHTQTIDVAQKLGYKPVGDGKHRNLARLPFNEVFSVDLTEKTFHLPQLPPAWDGLTILHLSDIHLCGTPEREFYFHILDICKDWNPDLLALTGDIVDSPRHHRWVLPVLGRLRWQCAAFAILGNHDVWYDPQRTRRRLERLKIKVLGNSWQQLEVRGQPLVVIGHEGPWFGPPPDLTNCPPDAFRLLLSHTPDNIPWARRHRIDLMLAGHNHGGQIRLPVIGSIVVPSRFSRRYDCGVFHEEPTLLHVSRGLGGQHPLRYNCRPEVTKIVLKASSR
ncbi:MAG: metallophosphoesterase [Planctomycetia bacterium]|nr:metallophosphoesterase [Planctomycetia bacterium]